MRSFLSFHLQAGTCDGMTYEEMFERMPEEYALRKKDKLTYRWVGRLQCIAATTANLCFDSILDECKRRKKDKLSHG